MLVGDRGAFLSNLFPTTSKERLAGRSEKHVNLPCGRRVKKEGALRADFRPGGGSQVMQHDLKL